MKNKTKNYTKILFNCLMVSIFWGQYRKTEIKNVIFFLNKQIF